MVGLNKIFCLFILNYNYINPLYFRRAMYILEGNIGTGKSTFLRLLKTHAPHIKIILEPVHNWQKKLYGQSLLANFYTNPKRWAYTFETLTMMYRVKEHLKEQQYTEQPKVIERSIYSGYYCFAQNGYQQGFLDDTEWFLYKEWFTLLVSGKCRTPKGFIYLRVNPEIAYKRIKKRKRDAEKTMHVSYVKQIHDQHEQFLVEKLGILQELKNVPVLLLDCNQEFETDMARFEQHVHELMSFINQTYQTIQTPHSKQLVERLV